jgi:pilus assembly protein Flp/PilA
MNNQLWKLAIKMQSILNSEDGQDLIEYALVVSLLAFAATAAMSGLATNISSVFAQIGTKLTSSVA